MHADIIWGLRVMPSALISCILQQAETIRIASLSTTRMRHSTAAALATPTFLLAGPL